MNTSLQICFGIMISAEAAARLFCMWIMKLVGCTGLPSKHRPGRQYLLEHPTRRLEACAQHQLHHLWPAIPLSGGSSILLEFLGLQVTARCQAAFAGSVFMHLKPSSMSDSHTLELVVALVFSGIPELLGQRR